jgi:RNA-directed DNA polymerase
MIRHTNNISSESWEFLPWKKFHVNLFRLQKRVYKSIRADDMQNNIIWYF